MSGVYDYKARQYSRHASIIYHQAALAPALMIEKLITENWRLPGRRI
jgi:hypothetical protein